MDFLATPARRRFLFCALYLSEGAPIGYLWWALPTRLAQAGVPVGRITALTAMLVLPWSFKFLWAPMVDILRSGRWGFRSWIAVSQAVMGLSLLPLAGLDLKGSLSLVTGLLLVHAFAAATQDVAVDALSIASVPHAERGSLNGWMQAGMLAGRSVFGGLALMAERWVGQAPVIAALVAVTWCSLALLLVSHPDPTPPSPGRAGRFLEALRAAARGRVLWLGLGFAAVGGAAFEAAAGVAGPYLTARNLSTDTIGGLFALPAPACMVAGALAGGYVADRMGRRSATAITLIMTAACVVSLGALDSLAGPPSGRALIVVFSLLYVCIGLFTASSYALLMDLTGPGLGATQFSAYMGATNGCEAWAIFTIGRVAPAAGYPTAFLIMAALSLLALPMLAWLPDDAGDGTRPPGGVISSA